MRSNELKCYQLSYVNAKKRKSRKGRERERERDDGSERGSTRDFDKNFATICNDPTINSAMYLIIITSIYSTDFLSSVLARLSPIRISNKRSTIKKLYGILQCGIGGTV